MSDLTHSSIVLSADSPPLDRTEKAARLSNRAAFICLLAATIYTPLTYGGFVPEGAFGLRMSCIVGLTALLTSAVLRGVAIRMSLGALLLLAFLLLAGISAAFSPYQYGSWRTMADLSTYASGFVLALGTLRTASRRRGWQLVLFATAALLGLYGVLQWLGYDFTARQMASRIPSFFFNSNHYGGYLALVLPAVFWAALRSKGPSSILLYALTLVLLFNLAFSFSWAIVPTAIACLLLIVFRTAKRPLLSVMALVGITLGLSGLGVAALRVLPQLQGGTAQARISNLVETWMTRSVESRVLIWRGAARLALDAPALGVGPGNFVYTFPLHRSPVHNSFATAITHAYVGYAHSDYLQIASELGLIALALFIAFWSAVLIAGRRRAETLGLRVALLATLCYAFFDNPLTLVPASAFLAFCFAGLIRAERTSS
ncbi:O-antigen ligase family protein [Deinococcus yavapaiensis]|uniref:O-antigen ligase n=1 Tax=Deinococcus yavapaiensis KR-236 TaxID=694435 RepID=A0A318S8Y6_9DEIO|nr:O-antigen ligase family protein [Deinococcus yavapaiensis]PYE55661.1 O-antigen ligase [Deinococcus yavapaiensis KR-236]